MQRWILIGIITVAFLLRVFGLSEHPSGFHADEASFGYDAYSILKTGKDQWGHSFPLVLRSFGDDKLPLYSYLAIPSIAILGLNEFSVRLPGAIIGTLAVIAIYILVKEITKSHSQLNEKIAIFAAFLMAINPWHVMLSRGAFESNLTNLFLPLGVYFFLKGKKFLILSFGLFLINLFTYHTARLLTPLVFLFLIFIYKDRLRQSKTFVLAMVFSVVLFTFSIAGVFLGGSRIATSSLLDINFLDDRYNAYLTGETGFQNKIFYNQPLYVLRQFITNYLSYFSPQFLFLNGAGEATYGMVPGVGVFYLVEILFLFGFLIKTAKDGLDKEKLLIIFLLFISFIPASLTKGPGYAGNRAAFAITPLIILMAIGGFYLYQRLKNNIWLYFYGMFLLLNFFYLSERYWVGQKAVYAKNMTYGMEQVISYVNQYKDKNIIISRAISEPQIFVGFYGNIDPLKYQLDSSEWRVVNGWVDQQPEYKLDNYTFRDLNYSVDSKLTNTVLISSPKDFPSEIKPDFVVYYPNQEPAYYIIVNN